MNTISSKSGLPVATIVSDRRSFLKFAAGVTATSVVIVVTGEPLVAGPLSSDTLPAPDMPFGLVL